MESTMTEIVEQFHDLRGVTVSEKRRNLFQLFHNLSPVEAPALLDLITPRTHLERIFKVELLLYFRCTQKILEEFLKGDEIIVSKIAKQNWFFQNSFAQIGPEFVNQFLPTLSLSLRLKVLKRLVLVLTEKQNDELFDALLRRYGVFMATNILTGCSPQKIEQILQHHPIQLWTSQLKLVYSKNPDLIYIYFEEREKHSGKIDCWKYSPIFKFVAAKNPEMFCNLQEKYNLEYLYLGKRTTKKLIRAKKDTIMAKPHLYAKNLNPSRLVRTLGPDFKQLYLELFPKKINDVFNSYLTAPKLLKYYPKKHRFELFRQTFDQTFYKKIETRYDLIRPNLFEMITDHDEREKWASIKFAREDNDSYLKYFKAQKCIDAIKQKFNVSQVAKRTRNMVIITETCLINRDWEALLKVLELLCTRFKNDDKEVYLAFLQTMIMPKYNFTFKNLNESHWKYIKEEIARQNFDASPSLLFPYFEFLFECGKLDESEVTRWLKGTGWIRHLNHLNQSNPQSHRDLLKILIKVAPLIKQKCGTIENIDFNLILVCPKDNSVNIFDYPRLLQSLRKALVNKNTVDIFSLHQVIKRVICTKDRTEEIEDLTELYWANYENVVDMHSAMWFLRHRPELIAKNIDKFVEVTISHTLLENRRYLEIEKFWRTIKCYTHLGIDKKMIEYCTSKLNDDNFTKKCDLMDLLATIMAPQDFISLAETYKPLSPTYDPLDKASNHQFVIRRYLLKSFVKVDAPETVSHLVLEFCRGDYVASCLSPLSSCLHRIPEERVRSILERLCQTGAVSVKKHGFYFVCVIMDEATILESLKSCRLTQSIAMAYQHFVKNPSHQSWDLVNSKLPKLDKSDHFTSLVLVNTAAPKKYKCEYFEAAFEVFRKQNNKFTNVLLDKVRKETVGELQTRFFAGIKEDFLEMHKSGLLFVYYLLCCEDEVKFEMVFDALRFFKDKRWCFSNHKARGKLHGFIQTFFTTYLEWEKTDEALVAKFLTGFQGIFSPVEAFEEFIVISMMKFKGLDTDNLSKAVVELNNSLVGDYGKLIISVFADCLEKLLPKFCENDVNVLRFHYSLCCNRQSTDDALLVIRLLPKTEPQLKQCANFYYSTLDLLKKIEDETVQVHLNLHFRT